jgi:hypothetical protein
LAAAQTYISECNSQRVASLIGGSILHSVDIFSLQVYTLPFSLLPSSVVERPGNIIMQTLLDRLVPVFLEQLLEDYKNWVQMDTFASDGKELFSSTKSIIELDEP